MEGRVGIRNGCSDKGNDWSDGVWDVSQGG